MHRPPWERRPWRLDVAVGVVFAVLVIALIVTIPKTPTLSLQVATLPPTTSLTAAPTTSPTLVVPTPPPRDVPPGPLPEVLTRVPTTDPVVFLTIDDGAVKDPEVLAKIRQAKVPVSLFLVESEARADVGYFADLVAAGASIQNHALTHPDLRTLSPAAQAREVCGWTTLGPQLFGGKAPTLFRPPFGYFDDSVRRAAAGCGFSTMVLWHATVNDGVLLIQGREKLLPGDIILMHFRPDLSENLSVVFAALAAEGLGVGRLEDYVRR